MLVVVVGGGWGGGGRAPGWRIGGIGGLRCTPAPLCLAADVMALDSPYRIFKSPIFAPYTLLAQNDGVFGGINCGVMYFQNASPSGPVAWAPASLGAVLLCLPHGMLARTGHVRRAPAPGLTASRARSLPPPAAVDRVLRYFENKTWFDERFPPWVQIWEQPVWNDMVRDGCGRARVWASAMPLPLWRNAAAEQPLAAGVDRIRPADSPRVFEALLRGQQPGAR